MVYLVFAVLAGITSYCAIKLSDAAEKFEKYSKMNAVLIGAILAVATSLPEFASSLTSSLWLDDPIASISNPLGSNMFNIVILAVLNIYFFKKIVNGNIQRSNNRLNILVILLYGITYISVLNPDVPFLAFGHLNLITIIYFTVYGIGLYLSGKDNGGDSIAHEDNPQEMKKAIIQFIIFAIIVLISSVGLSLSAKEIIELSGLDAGFVGALFLGVATSLPELISSFVLCKNGAYNIAAANIIGSNLFNFIIIAINNIFYKEPIWKSIALVDGITNTNKIGRAHV